MPDTPGHNPEGKSFCDTSDPLVLGQVLNNYDRSTTDFYRWEQEYTREELTNLIVSRSGIDIGELVGLRPLERGGSGRITLLEVVGTKKSFKVGKELEIRRILSESHLRSSAFEVFYRHLDGELVREPGPCGVSCCGADASGRTASWTSLVLKGKGWGHGVGLCQIGAAVMASQGCTFREILEHYYPGAVVGPVPDFVAGAVAGPVQDSVLDSVECSVPDSVEGKEGGRL